MTCWAIYGPGISEGKRKNAERTGALSTRWVEEIDEERRLHSVSFALGLVGLFGVGV
jgi:hypothetical protein